MGGGANLDQTAYPIVLGCRPVVALGPRVELLREHDEGSASDRNANGHRKRRLEMQTKANALEQKGGT